MGEKSHRRGLSKSRLSQKNPCGKLAHKIFKKIKKTTKKEAALSSEKIIKVTKCSPKFIGCFSEKVLPTLKFFKLPVYLMVHIGEKTGHWISLGIFNNKIEIFDPLGFQIFDWPALPVFFLRFLYNLSTRKQLIISGKVQPKESHLCGYYCLTYILKRPFMSLSGIESLFSNLKTNDKTLLSLF